MSGIDKRGELVSMLGAALSLAAAVVLALLAIWSGSVACWAAAFQAFGAVGIWVITLIQLHQQRLVREEELEVAALQRERSERLGGAQTIFEEEELDQMEKLAMGRRLRSIERYLVPTVALIVAAFHIIAGASVFPWRGQFPPIRAIADAEVLHQSVLLFFGGGIAFVTFMVSRYALGLGRLRLWSLLRASGNASFGTSAAALGIAVSMLCLISGLTQVERSVAYVIAVVVVWIGVEAILNFILDFYRPRIAGEIQRPFYDCRLLGAFSEPGGILRSVANAIDYQFGFKVSETWFYKLLGQAIVPLLLVQALVILALTCIVVVPPGHQAVITRFGRLRDETAKPGIHVTYPWPVDRATVIPVERIRRMELGYEHPVSEPEEERFHEPKLILWTVKHFKKEYHLVVADRAASASAKVPINLLSLNMPIQWRIRPEDRAVIRYHAQSADVEKTIEALAYRELTRYAAGADVHDLMGRGGIKTSEALHRRLQEACDRAGYDGGGLGVEIVHLGIGGVHPPPDDEVAKNYEEVVSAYEIQEATIRAAEGDAAETRVRSAGDRWRELYDAIVREDAAKASNAADLPERTAEVERLLSKAVHVGGDARRLSGRAAADAYEWVFDQKSEVERYEVQRAAFEVAPDVYKLREYLRMLESALRDVRKYVIVLENSDSIIYDIDLKPPTELDILAAERLAAEQKAKP